MSDIETRLAAALNAGAPPARDAAFRIEVLVRLERARFRRHVGRALTVAALLAVLAALSLPLVVPRAAADGGRLWLVTLAAAAALCAPLVLLLRPRLRTATTVVSRMLYP
jgi:hypothetical protein